MGTTPDERIDELIRDLASPDNDTQLRAENELIGVGEPAVESLIEATKSTNPQVRWRAAFCLGEIGDERGYPVVLALLNETDYYVRAEAVDAVAKLGGERAIDELADVVREAEEHQHGADHAAWALRWMGQAAVPVLIDIVLTGSRSAKAPAMDALGDIGDTQAIDPIARFLGDEDIRLEAASALATLGDARGLDDLIGFLRSCSDEDDEHYGCWSSLAKLGATAMGPLLEVAASGAIATRQEALRLLGEIGDSSAIAGLTALDVESGLELDVLAARGECGDTETLAPLIDALERGLAWDGDAYHRLSEALGRLGEAAVAPLAEVVRSDNRAVREETARALGETGCESAIQPLAELLSDDDAEVRAAAVGALGHIAEDNHASVGNMCLTLIEPLCNDPDGWVRNGVAIYTDVIRSRIGTDNTSSGGE